MPWSASRLWFPRNADSCRHVGTSSSATQQTSNRTTKFQGVTRNGLRLLGLAHLKLQFESLNIEHPVVVVNKIAHKFILGNDFLVKYRCDILNSDGVIVFGNKSMQYTLFRSTINLICPVICQSHTEIGPYEEAVIPGLLDTY